MSRVVRANHPLHRWVILPRNRLANVGEEPQDGREQREGWKMSDATAREEPRDGYGLGRCRSCGRILEIRHDIIDCDECRIIRTRALHNPCQCLKHNMPDQEPCHNA